MKTLLTATALSAMLTAGVAVAMQAESTPPKAPLTKAEMLARADARFDKIDTNRDGQLSAQERTAAMEKAAAARAERKGGEMADFMPGRGKMGGAMGERMLARVDTNGDGLISKAENRAAVEARFARMDADKDGAIEAGERRGPGMGKRDGMGKDMGGKRGEGRRMARREGRGPGGPGGMMLADTNKDGAISRAEFDAMSAQRFARLDANQDGRLDAGELRHGRKTPPPPPAAPPSE